MNLNDTPGVMAAEPPRWCPECRSAGVVGIEQDVCPTCNGTGKVAAPGVDVPLAPSSTEAMRLALAALEKSVDNFQANVQHRAAILALRAALAAGLPAVETQQGGSDGR